MLTKQSNQVMKHILSKYTGDAEKYIEIYPKDVDLDYTVLNNICVSLEKQGYINPFFPSYNNNDPVSITMTHEGINYVEIHRKRFFRMCFKNLWIPLTITALTKIVPILLRCLRSMIPK